MSLIVRYFLRLAVLVYLSDSWDFPTAFFPLPPSVIYRWREQQTTTRVDVSETTMKNE